MGDCFVAKATRNEVWGKQSGYLLLPVVVAIALIGMIAYFIANQSAVEVDAASGEFEAARADYVVRAGLQHGLREAARQGCGPYTDLSNVEFGDDQYDTGLVTGLGATESYTAGVDRDSWIRDDFPDNNYAVDTEMHIRNEGGVIERPVLRYDLSAIPADATILSARAWFYVDEEFGEGPVDIHRVIADWNEADATWSTLGNSIGDTVVSSLPAQPAPSVWVAANLTAQVQAWVNGEINYGIALNAAHDGVHGHVSSRESSFAPYLEVVVGTAPTTAATLQAVATLDSGVTRAMLRGDVTLRQQPPQASRVQPGPDKVDDSWITGGQTAWNYGGHNLINVNEGGGPQRGLVRFDLDGMLPHGAILTEARLELYAPSVSGSGQVRLYGLHRGWTEGSCSGVCAGGAVTWSTTDGTQTWSTPGGDADSAPVAEVQVGPSNTWYSWDVTTIARQWAAGTRANHGLLISGEGADVSFNSSDHSDTATHPKITLGYTCSCGQVCTAPRGSGEILMVVINPTTLVAEDQQARDLFESWGYSVSVISESANQADYDAAIAAADVVFVSETVNSNQVGSKLVNAPIGVVSQDGDYNADLGLATGSARTVGGAIDVTDSRHYITRPFASGSLGIYAADMEQLTASGSLGAGQRQLAESSGLASLIVLDAGDAMEGGGTAAGRRVMLPLGTRYRFNWDHLNANGHLLVQRALEWGAGGGALPMGDLLLVVDDDASLSGQEQAKKALFESWGYTVSVIDSGDGQGTYDSAVAVNDVVYIGEDINSGDLGSKLVDATIGVVTEENNLSDEFGLSDSIHWGSGTSLDIDNRHYITQPLVAGSVTILSSSESLADLTGSLAPDLRVIGQATDGPALATVDTGESLILGGTAAGRRVFLPWGGNDMDVNNLTDDGRTILQRSLEWGAGAANPVFPTRLLFVVTDPASLSAYESAKKSLIESWGYEVNLIDDADSVTDYAAALGANDLIYVSGEVSDGAIGSKLTKAPLGLVNEQISLHDELLLSTAAASNNFNRVLVIDNTHYITEGINTGWHSVASSDQPLNALTGTLAPDLTNLAEVWISGANYDFGLAVVDTGGRLNAGEIAPGRRAQLPWGTSGFDFGALNANGQNLMRRAIEWAGGAEIDLSPLAHWKLDETSGPTAVDSEGGHDGTWSNGPTPAAAVLDGGLEFDGIDDAIVVSDADTLDLTETMSFIAWVKSDEFGASGPYDLVVSKGNVATSYAYYFGALDDEIIFGFSASGVYREFVTPNLNLATGSWHHIAATYSNALDTVRLYHNGVEVLSATTSYQPSATDHDLYIGSSEDGADWDGVLDDVRIYDRLLDVGEIADLYATGAPPGPGFTELYQPWDATADDTWQTVDLSGFGVPANAVVEVAIYNDAGSAERWGGVRAVGSTLERRFHLHEAEQGGTDVVTMHVQADASSRIQHYSDNGSDVRFALLGYWTGASYAELFEPFTANGSNSWVQENLNNDGAGPDMTVEIVMQNTNTGAERLAGLRSVGSSYQRRFNLQEAEGGGVDAATMLVNTDADSEIEVYAQNSGDVDFHVVGYWSTPPGSYTENGTDLWNPSSNNWETVNLAAAGVPGEAVVNVMMTNLNTGAERWMGLRAVGSSQNRRLDLHEPEGGGADLASFHVVADSGSNIQSYSEASGASNRFAPVGWWVLSP